MLKHPLVVRNTASTVRRFGAILVVLALGAATLLTLTGVVGTAVGDTASTLDTDSSLSVLELSSTSPRGETEPLTVDAMRTLAGMPGVQSVAPYAQVGVAIIDAPGADADTAQALAGVFWATPRIRWVQPDAIGADEGSQELTGRQVLLPDHYLGSDLSALVGTDVRIQYTRRTGRESGEAAEMTLTVAGVFDNAVSGHDGESAAYVSDDTFEELLAASAGGPGGDVPAGFVYPSAYVKTTSSAVTADVQGAITAAGYYAQNPATTARALPGVLGIVTHVGTFLGIGLLVFCVGVGVSMGGTWSALRRWDVGLLTALGWRRGRIARAYGAEVLLVGLLVGLVAAVLGTAASVLVGIALDGRSVLGSSFSGAAALPPVGWLLTAALGVPLALTLGSLPRVLRLARLDPEIALRRRD